MKSNAVECFAPGEIVLARFGSKTRGGDSSFVLARHRMLPSEGRLLGSPPLDEKDDDQGRNADLFLAPYDIVLVPASNVADVNLWVDQYIRQNIPISPRDVMIGF